MIVPRLVLGTARIAGGADERRAIDLIRGALDAGVTAVDTAPSYGMGTAEVAVGKAVRGYEGATVATKLGSSPPSFGWLRTAVRRAKRGLTGRDAADPVLPARAIEGPTGNDFTARAMAASLARSLDRLGPITALLLHDISAGEVTREVLADLARLSASAGARQGYANYSQWDAQVDGLFPADQIAQCAPFADWLRGTGIPPAGRALRLHSVGKTGLALAAGDPGFAASLDRAAKASGRCDRQTAELAALYALAAVRLPDALLLVTSSHRRRLEALLAALAGIDAAGSAEEIAALFPLQAG